MLILQYGSHSGLYVLPNDKYAKYVVLTQMSEPNLALLRELEIDISDESTELPQNSLNDSVLQLVVDYYLIITDVCLTFHYQETSSLYDHTRSVLKTTRSKRTLEQQELIDTWSKLCKLPFTSALLKRLQEFVS